MRARPTVWLLDLDWCTYYINEGIGTWEKAARVSQALPTASGGCRVSW